MRRVQRAKVGHRYGEDISLSAIPEDEEVNWESPVCGNKMGTQGEDKTRPSEGNKANGGGSGRGRGGGDSRTKRTPGLLANTARVRAAALWALFRSRMPPLFSSRSAYV